MIGHLQSNKSKDAVHLFDLIHSIDKEETAKKVNIEAEKVNKIQNILIQVNTAGESQKSGCDPENLIKIFNSILPLKNIKILGLMAIAPFTDDEIIIGNCFSKARKLLEQINDTCNIQLKELSMGMSSDYKIALAEGATMVRIGSAIFGNRNYK
jgi:pyridoxal phosphate enzyme (YggS family)